MFPITKRASLQDPLFPRTYGMSISSGIFIPTLLTGAAWGRIVGTLLYRFFPETDWGDVGKYSLIGASAQLSGTIRLTYSLTAIILEATGRVDAVTFGLTTLSIMTFGRTTFSIITERPSVE